MLMVMKTFFFRPEILVSSVAAEKTPSRDVLKLRGSRPFRISERVEELTSNHVCYFFSLL